MKGILMLFVLIFSISFYGQNEIKITSKKHIPNKGFYLKLKSVFDDSRCPEGITCIWQGEVSAIIEVYKDKKIWEEKTITFNSKNREENLKWFETYYSKKIKGIGVMPYPKEGQKIPFNKQYVKVTFTD